MQIDDPRFAAYREAQGKYFSGGGLKPGYISSQFALGGYGNPLYELKPTYSKRYVNRPGRGTSGYVSELSRPGLYIYKDPNYRAPAPAPATASAAAAAPQATLRVQAPTTPQVSTNQSANQVAALQKALTDSIASFQAQMGQQTQSYQKQLADYQTQAQQQFQTYQQQSQAQLAAAQQQAEESQRQMMIGLAQRDRAPAEVKMAESGAAQRGLTRRGTTGYFGRQGMRIGSLNVPTSGLTISTDAASRAASGSFM